MIKKILRWIENMAIIFLILFIALYFYSAMQAGKNPSHVTSIAGYKPMVVLSGSMRPAIKAGDMIIAKDVKWQDIKEGDVITYRVNQETLVTHRVIGILQQEGRVMFRTKGDANNMDDQAPVAPEQIIGALAFRIPYGGYIANFIRTSAVFILLILLSIIYIMGVEIRKFVKTRGSYSNDP